MLVCVLDVFGSTISSVLLFLMWQKSNERVVVDGESEELQVFWLEEALSKGARMRMPVCGTRGVSSSR